MKRYNNLYNKIVDINNIRKAAINSQKNKKTNLQNKYLKNEQTRIN